MSKDHAPQSAERGERVRRKKNKRRPVPDLGPFRDRAWGASPDPGQPAWVPSQAEAARVPETVRQALMPPENLTRRIQCLAAQKAAANRQSAEAAKREATEEIVNTEKSPPVDQIRREQQDATNEADTGKKS